MLFTALVLHRCRLLILTILFCFFFIQLLLKFAVFFYSYQTEQLSFKSVLQYSVVVFQQKLPKRQFLLYFVKYVWFCSDSVFHFLSSHY